MAKRNIKPIKTKRPRSTAEGGMVRIYNKSKQTVPLQAKPEGGDFFLHEQQVRIGPGKSILIPKSYLLSHQVDNLCKRGILQVTFDSDTQK